MSNKYEELADAASSVTYWERNLSGAISQKQQAEVDIKIAENELRAARDKVNRVITEQRGEVD